MARVVKVVGRVALPAPSPSATPRLPLRRFRAHPDRIDFRLIKEKRHVSQVKLALAVAVLSLAPAAARAEKLDKEDKKWLDEVRPIMLPDEEKTFRDLKDKADRDEFQKIFWARRDPDLETAENEFQATYNAERAEVDRQFRVAGQNGSATDCGRVYLLLGKPDEMKQDKQSGDAPSLRPPEVWTYRDRPGQTFAGGQVQIAFEEDCLLPQGARLGEQLNKVGGEQDRPSEPRLQEGAGRQARQARRPAAQAEPGAGPAEGAAPGLPGHHAERDDAAQPGRGHLRRRPRPCRGRAP